MNARRTYIILSETENYCSAGEVDNSLTVYGPVLKKRTAKG